eukprot:116962-Amphidinium_carterae.1
MGVSQRKTVRFLPACAGAVVIRACRSSRLHFDEDEDQMTELRRSLHPHFFAVELLKCVGNTDASWFGFASQEVGQRYFKQSNTRLNYIAGKILEMTGEFFKDHKLKLSSGVPHIHVSAL